MARAGSEDGSGAGGYLCNPIRREGAPGVIEGVYTTLHERCLGGND